MRTRDPIIVYTVVSKSGRQIFGYRTERMALHPNLPTCHTDRRTDRDRRPYRIAWRARSYGPNGLTGSWWTSCLGVTGNGWAFLGDTPEALAWLLEGEEK